jgi:hypothetical protein
MNINAVINSSEVKRATSNMYKSLLSGKVAGMAIPTNKKQALKMAANWAVWACNA